MDRARFRTRQPGPVVECLVDCARTQNRLHTREPYADLRAAEGVSSG